MSLSNRLLYARSKLNLSEIEVSEESNIDSDLILKFESGIEEPSISQLTRLAKVYLRSFDWFLLDDEISESKIKWCKFDD